MVGYSPTNGCNNFLDGSEQHIDGNGRTGYNYSIYQNGKQIASGYGAINSLSHAFDGEAIGAGEGLRHSIQLSPDVRQYRLWLCIDSTSVNWCLRGDASNSSQ
jgi:hypothetical protein